MPNALPIIILLPMQDQQPDSATQDKVTPATERPAKQLCRTPGCSFRTIPELGQLCKDCFEGNYYKGQVHFYVHK